ncbi:MAG: hypothetical protein H6684_14765 [Deltaproteobacteria bacterium]|nr:hypothetical protein [Deltaproteobacteria bacterium]MCB9489992.1 hypothetical protein [Deltaproteobacteria bacterium]
MPRRCVRSLISSYVSFAILTSLVWLTPTAVQARTIYWEDFEDCPPWDVEVIHASGLTWAWQNGFWECGEYLSLLLNEPDYESAIDNYLISPSMNLSAKQGIRLHARIGVEHEDISNGDMQYSVGVRSGGPNDDQPLSIYYSVNGPIDKFWKDPLDLDDALVDATDVRLWWRFAAQASYEYGAFGATLQSVCLTDECSTQAEIKNHADTFSGYETFHESDTLISCFPSVEAGQYLRGIRYSIYGSEKAMTYRELIFRSDNDPSAPPLSESAIIATSSKNIPTTPTSMEVELNCDQDLIEEMDPGANWCIGLQIINTKGGEYHIDYENVGEGNSNSYRKDGPHNWTSMNDKELLFTAITDTDCDIVPTTTTSTTTTTGASTSTTTTTATTPSTTTTIPADDDTTDDDDSLDDDDIVDSNDDDSSGCGS